ncbi:hypothetical protein Q5M87_02640 [Brachyspira innocens]|uniref:Uncharacterized protein n=1 Tax=Brachyspira innocens TaxID=13264 RepID=A0ABT8YTQ4_9SPIR|nr:hypothetical protein [Brachyspira innocens]MDO6992898.1 hypothetical protein [Brachyspira innocens]MDO7019163.1 hypothetical protein [Brachyspira innocens]
MAQTTVQHRKTVRSGSGTVSIGTRFDNMVNIGACRGIGIKETMTSTDIESDNAGVISTLLSAHKAEITFDSLELNLRNYYLARGGIDNLKDYDGYTEAERKYIVESGSYEKGEIIRVPFKNADGSAVEIIKVEKRNSSGNTLIDEAGYEKIDTNGIKIISSKISPDADSLIIHFKQTPPKMVRFTTGGKASTIKPRCLMVVNKDADGKEFRVYIPQASVAGGLEFTLPSDKAQDVWVGKFSFTASIAGGQEAGEQLAWIEDEQATSDIKELLRVKIDADSAETKVSETVNLNIETNAEEIIANVENNEIADIEYADGILNITGKKEGTTNVKITAKREGSEDIVKNIAVKVIEALRMEILEEEKDIKVGEKANITVDTNATEVLTTIEDEEIASIEYADGQLTITAKKAGATTAEIRAKKEGSDDIVKEMIINVIEVLTLEADKETANIMATQSDTIVLTSNADEIIHSIEPTEQVFCEIEYDEISKTFTINALAEGTATLKITAKKAAGQELAKDIVINITPSI